MSALLDHLATLSSAEQFFETLDLPFEQSVINVHRLHILKGFKDRMRKNDVSALDEDAVLSKVRELLMDSYNAFAEGLGEKTFKVFEDAKSGKSGIVSLDSLLPPGVMR